MSNQYVYEWEGRVYLNLTNRCNNACDFCIRKNPQGIKGCDLWLDQEPSAPMVLDQLRPFGKTDVVFCGYGEPTLRLDVLKEVAAAVKAYGGKTRLNTNGLANRYYGRNIVPELVGKIDLVSISLNEASAEKYQAICHSEYGLAAYGEMLDFAKKCVQAGLETCLSVVDVIAKEDIETCAAIAKEIGAKLRIRAYQTE